MKKLVGMPSRPPTRLVQTGEGFKTATEVKVEKLQAQKELPLTEDPHFERERRLFLPNDPAGEAIRVRTRARSGCSAE